MFAFNVGAQSARHRHVWAVNSSQSQMYGSEPARANTNLRASHIYTFTAQIKKKIKNHCKLDRKHHQNSFTLSGQFPSTHSTANTANNFLSHPHHKSPRFRHLVIERRERLTDQSDTAGRQTEEVRKRSDDREKRSNRVSATSNPVGERFKNPLITIFNNRFKGPIICQ